MKRKNIIAFSVALMAIGAFTSCSDEFLQDKKNYDYVDASTYNTFSGAKARVDDIYAWCLPNTSSEPSWKYNSTGAADLQSKSTEEYSGFGSFVDPDAPMTSQSGNNTVPDYFHNSGNNIQASVWGRIRNCNDVIYGIENSTLSEEEKNELLGQVYFFRAWWHFELLKMYGGKAKNGKALGIPLADHFISQDEAAQNGEFLRPTYQATVDFIVNDLNNAIELLPNVYQGDDLEFGNTQIGRATKAAAAVLKSRALLYSASPAMQDDDVTKITGMGQFEILNPTVYQAKWEAVAKEINKILGMEGFGTYVPVTASSIADVQTESSDYAFRRYFNNNLLEGLHFPPFYYGSARATPSHNLVKAFYAKNGYPATDVRSGVDLSDPDFDLTQLYAVLDNRFALNVYYHSATFGDSGQPLDMSEGGKDSPSFSENATRTGYYLAKFVSKKSAMLNPIQTLNSVHYNPLLRKSEVLLNFAEAANEAWGNPTVKVEGCLYSAYEILKTIRSQAGGINFDLYLDEMAQSKDSFRKLIQNERRLEFTFENHRYFDMRRWVLPLNEEVEGVAVTRNEDGTFSFKVQKVEQRKYEVKNYFMPLPYAELEKNKNLMNNQGWE